MVTSHTYTLASCSRSTGSKTLCQNSWNFVHFPLCGVLKFSIHGHVYKGLQYHTIPVMTESYVLLIKIDTWHLHKVQSNATQQDYYPLITLCIPLLYMMSPVDTLTEHQPLCLWHHTTENTLISNSIIWHDVATTGYKNLCTCCSLTFWQLHKL